MRELRDRCLTVCTPTAAHVHSCSERWHESDEQQVVTCGRPAFFFKQRIENGRKVETPALDGRQWMEWPA